MRSAKHFLQAHGGVPEYRNWSTDQPPGTGLPHYLNAIDAEINANPGAIVTCRDGFTDSILQHLRSRNNFGLHVNRSDQTVEVADKNLSELALENTASVVVVRCRIGKVILRAGNRNTRLVDCDIGWFEFTGNSRALAILGGSIERFELDYDITPLRGPVEIRAVSLPDEYGAIQGLRMLRAELLDIHNTVAASELRAAELRIDRRSAPTSVKAISWSYDFISAYGTSAWQPLTVFASLAFSNIVILSWPPNTVAVGALQGWQRSLAGSSLWDGLQRAVVLTFSQVFNPLGIFNKAPLIIATDSGVALLSTGICLLATAALAFFFFAVRRHVKLDG